MPDELDKIIEQLKDGFPVKTEELVSLCITLLLANSMLTSEVLKRVIALEQQVKEGFVDDEKVVSEVKQIADKIANQANTHRIEMIARIASGSKDQNL
jgi:hypothetical protein